MRSQRYTDKHTHKPRKPYIVRGLRTFKVLFIYLERAYCLRIPKPKHARRTCMPIYCAIVSS